VRGSSEQSYERVWLLPDHRTYVSYVVDHNLGVRYLAVQGENAEMIAESLTSQLPTLSREDVRHLVECAADRDAKIGTVYYVAAFVTEVYDPELFEFFRRLLSDPQPEVRRAAIFAASYPAWREFEPLLRDLQANDPDEQVRHLAHVTLNSLEQHVWHKL
jgi:hypothetical protein